MADNDRKDVPISCNVCKALALIKSGPGSNDTSPRREITDLIKMYFDPVTTKLARAPEAKDIPRHVSQIVFLCKRCFGVAEKNNLAAKPQQEQDDQGNVANISSQQASRQSQQVSQQSQQASRQSQQVSQQSQQASRQSQQASQQSQLASQQSQQASQQSQQPSQQSQQAKQQTSQQSQLSIQDINLQTHTLVEPLSLPRLDEPIIAKVKLDSQECQIIDQQSMPSTSLESHDIISATSTASTISNNVADNLQCCWCLPTPGLMNAFVERYHWRQNHVLLIKHPLKQQEKLTVLIKVLSKDGSLCSTCFHELSAQNLVSKDLLEKVRWKMNETIGACTQEPNHKSKAPNKDIGYELFMSQKRSKGIAAGANKQMPSTITKKNIKRETNKTDLNTSVSSADIFETAGSRETEKGTAQQSQQASQLNINSQTHTLGDAELIIAKDKLDSQECQISDQQSVPSTSLGSHDIISATSTASIVSNDIADNPQCCWCLPSLGLMNASGSSYHWRKNLVFAAFKYQQEKLTLLTKSLSKDGSLCSTCFHELSTQNLVSKDLLEKVRWKINETVGADTEEPSCKSKSPNKDIGYEPCVSQKRTKVIPAGAKKQVTSTTTKKSVKREKNKTDLDSSVNSADILKKAGIRKTGKESGTRPLAKPKKTRKAMKQDIGVILFNTPKSSRTSKASDQNKGYQSFVSQTQIQGGDDITITQLTVDSQECQMSDQQAMHSGQESHDIISATLTASTASTNDGNQDGCSIEVKPLPHSEDETIGVHTQRPSRKRRAPTINKDIGYESFGRRTKLKRIAAGADIFETAGNRETGKGSETRPSAKPKKSRKSKAMKKEISRVPVKFRKIEEEAEKWAESVCNHGNQEEIEYLEDNDASNERDGEVVLEKGQRVRCICCGKRKQTNQCRQYARRKDMVLFERPLRIASIWRHVRHKFVCDNCVGLVTRLDKCNDLLEKAKNKYFEDEEAYLDETRIHLENLKMKAEKRKQKAGNAEKKTDESEFEADKTPSERVEESDKQDNSNEGAMNGDTADENQDDDFQEKSDCSELSRRKRWTKEECDKLGELVKKYGTKEWKLIAKNMKGKSEQQCKDRWLIAVDPDVNRSPFTFEEERITYDAYKRLGRKVNKIAKLVPGRTQFMVRSKITSPKWIKQMVQLENASGTDNLQVGKSTWLPSHNFEPKYDDEMKILKDRCYHCKTSFDEPLDRYTMHPVQKRPMFSFSTVAPSFIMENILKLPVPNITTKCNSSKVQYVFCKSCNTMLQKVYKITDIIKKLVVLLVKYLSPKSVIGKMFYATKFVSGSVITVNTGLDENEQQANTQCVPVDAHEVPRQDASGTEVQLETASDDHGEQVHQDFLERGEEIHQGDFVDIPLKMECTNELQNIEQHSQVMTPDFAQTSLEKNSKVLKNVIEVVKSSGLHQQCKLCLRAFQSNKECKCHVIYHIETFMREDEEKQREYHRKYLQEAKEKRDRKQQRFKKRTYLPSTNSQLADWTQIKSSLVDEIANKLGQPKTLGVLYRCNTCTNTEFKYFKHFIDHLQSCHGIVPVPEPWECKLCWKKFSRKYDLPKHACIQDLRGPSFKCDRDGCQAAFTTSARLDQHVKRHGQVFCKCGARFQNEDQLKIHMDLKHPSGIKLKCRYCHKTFESLSSRTYHEQSTHRGQAIMCDLCGKMFAHRNTLNSHQENVHAKNCSFKCTECKFITKHPANLRRHMTRIHQNKGFPITSSRPHCDCRKDDKEKQSLDEEGGQDLSPKYIDGLEENTMLVGGVSEMQRSVNWYTDVLNEAGCNLQQSSQEAGQLLGWALMKALISQEILKTHNLTGFSTANRKRIAFPLIDSGIMDAIFRQIKHQFPSFPCWHDRYCKTVSFLSLRLTFLRGYRTNRFAWSKDGSNFQCQFCDYISANSGLVERHEISVHSKKKGYMVSQSKLKCDCHQKDSKSLTLEEKGVVDISPRFTEGTEENTMLVGGVSEMQRSLKWYTDVLNEAGCNLQQSSQEAGQVLCWALMKALISQETLKSHNLMGYSFSKKSSSKLRVVPKIDSGIMDAIFHQVKYQFPSFLCWHDKVCKTVTYLSAQLRIVQDATAIEVPVKAKEAKSKSARKLEQGAPQITLKKKFTQGGSKRNKPNCQCKESELPTLEEEGMEEISPRYVDGPEENTMLVGGVSDRQRSVKWYTDVLNKSGCNLQQSSQEAGQLLGWALMKEILSRKTLETHNVTMTKQSVRYPKIDSAVMDAIFKQIQTQFPSFVCWNEGRSCKTMTFIIYKLNGIRKCAQDRERRRAKRQGKLSKHTTSEDNKHLHM